MAHYCNSYFQFVGIVWYPCSLIQPPKSSVIVYTFAWRFMSFWSLLTSSISTGIVSVDVLVMSMYGAATWLVLTVQDRYLLDRFVSISLKTFFRPSMWFIKISNFNRCTAHLWSFEMTCLSEVAWSANRAKSTVGFSDHCICSFVWFPKGGGPSSKMSALKHMLFSHRYYNSTMHPQTFLSKTLTIHITVVQPVALGASLSPELLQLAKTLQTYRCMCKGLGFVLEWLTSLPHASCLVSTLTLLCAIVSKPGCRGWCSLLPSFSVFWLWGRLFSGIALRGWTFRWKFGIHVLIHRQRRAKWYSSLANFGCSIRRISSMLQGSTW